MIYDPPMFVFVSDKYLNCLPIWCYTFNKFWKPKKHVKILGYKTPNFNLPSNFEFISMGEQVGGPENWSTPIRNYFETRHSWEENHIQWATEDSFLWGDVNFESYYYLTSYCQKNKGVGRVALTNDIVNLSGGHDVVEENLIKLQPNVNFRSSGTWSIFSKSLFFELMKPNISPWDFEGESSMNEKTGMRSVIRHYTLDDWDVIGLNSNQPLRTVCAIRTSRGINVDRAMKLPLDLRPIKEKKDDIYNCNVAKELREIGYLDEKNRLIEEKN